MFCKQHVALLCKMYTVIAERNFPAAGVDEANFELFCKKLQTIPQMIRLLYKFLILNPCTGAENNRGEQQKLIFFHAQAPEKSIHTF